MVVFWSVLIIVCMLIEIITVGLTSIWFAGGALAALIACGLHAPVPVQAALFFAVSLVLLLFTRPFAIKYLNPRRTRTNYEEAIGQKVRVTEEIDNSKETGRVTLKGMEWTARSALDQVVIPVGEIAEVTAVSGVKLIVR